MSTYRIKPLEFKERNTRHFVLFTAETIVGRIYYGYLGSVTRPFWGVESRPEVGGWTECIDDAKAALYVRLGRVSPASAYCSFRKQGLSWRSSLKTMLHPLGGVLRY